MIAICVLLNNVDYEQNKGKNSQQCQGPRDSFFFLLDAKKMYSATCLRFFLIISIPLLVNLKIFGVLSHCKQKKKLQSINAKELDVFLIICRMYVIL